MSSYLLYGTHEASIDSVKAELEPIFGIVLEERESSYQAGVYYICGNRGSEQFLLKRNIDPFDGEPVEQDFPDYSVIFYINATARASDLIALASSNSNFKLLRQEVL